MGLEKVDVDDGFLEGFALEDDIAEAKPTRKGAVAGTFDCGVVEGVCQSILDDGRCGTRWSSVT